MAQYSLQWNVARSAVTLLIQRYTNQSSGIVKIKNAGWSVISSNDTPILWCAVKRQHPRGALHKWCIILPHFISTLNLKLTGSQQRGPRLHGARWSSSSFHPLQGGECVLGTPVPAPYTCVWGWVSVLGVIKCVKLNVLNAISCIVCQL